MFPIQAPTQIIPDTIIFFDCPPTLEVINDSDNTSEVSRESRGAQGEDVPKEDW
jgi:hypothetical protein